MLSVKNLHASVDGKEILRGIDLEVGAGEVHAIMGPNGSGKSTLAAVLAGNEKFTVTEGSATFLGQDLLDMPIEDRARLGLFLGFQYPVEIPGVTMANFMKLAVNEQRKFRGEEPLTAAEFLRLMREKSAVVELDAKLTSRAVNEGFSGGEKKKNEIFQMAMLDPKLAILDETDSGLDIDALRIVATGVTKLHTPQNATVVITHYQRLLDYIVPDVVHVLYKGRIIHTGDKTLALKLEKEGYDWLINDYRELRLCTILSAGSARPRAKCFGLPGRKASLSLRSIPGVCVSRLRRGLRCGWPCSILRPRCRPWRSCWRRAHASY